MDNLCFDFIEIPAVKPSPPHPSAFGFVAGSPAGSVGIGRLLVRFKVSDFTWTCSFN